MSVDQFHAGLNGGPGDPNNWYYQQGMNEAKRARERNANAGNGSGAEDSFPGGYNLGPSMDPQTTIAVFKAGIVIVAIAFAFAIVFEALGFLHLAIRALSPVYGYLAVVAAPLLGLCLAKLHHGSNTILSCLGGILAVIAVGLLGAFPSSAVDGLPSILGVIGVLVATILVLAVDARGLLLKIPVFAFFAYCAGLAVYGDTPGNFAAGSPRGAWAEFVWGLFLMTVHLIGLVGGGGTMRRSGHVMLALAWLTCLMVGGRVALRFVLV